jgi:hypothetical protein
VEFLPFAGRPSISAELSLRVPTAHGLDGADGDDDGPDPEAPFLDPGDPVVVAKLRADQPWSPRAYLYAELGGTLRVDGEGPDGGTTPVKAIPHWQPWERLTLYAPIEVEFLWGGASTGDWSSQTGLGVKWRPRSGLEAEGLVTLFPAGRNSGAGNAFNLGVRIVR